MDTCTIEANEERFVEIIDIPGAYLHCDMDEHVIMLLKGRSEEMMAMFDPNLYMKFVIITSKIEIMLCKKYRRRYMVY